MRAPVSERSGCSLQGSITVFLSLTLLLIMTLVGALCTAAAVQTGKSRAKTRTSLALEAVFAEYDTDLLEQYHLFAYDAGRGGEDPEEGICGRVGYYGGGSDLSVGKIRYLSDQQGAAIAEQALRYMESRAEIPLIDRSRQTVIDGWSQSVGERLIEDAVTDLPGEFADLLSLFRMPLAQSVMPKGRVLSGAQIDLPAAPSHRALRSGRGSFVTSGGEGLAGEVLFDEYLTEVCDDASDDSSRLPAYETEYLIAGLDSDRKNLEAVAGRIIAMRMAVNTAYLRQDAAKQAEIESLAAFLALAAVSVGAEPAISEALTIAWAYAESMAEMRALLSGKCIAVTKTAQNWKIGLAGVLSLSRSAEESWETDDQEGGLSYGDFLRMFLAVLPRSKKAMRLADLIEINVSDARGGTGFRIDAAVCCVETESVCHLERGVTFRYRNVFVYR